MNCKPGDLARIIADAPQSVTPTQDLFCTVLRRVAFGSLITHPDGTYSHCSTLDAWEIELSRPIRTVRGDGVVVMAKYVVCRDAYLRPIRDPGEDAVDEVLQRIGSPNHVPA